MCYIGDFKSSIATGRQNMENLVVVVVCEMATFKLNFTVHYNVIVTSTQCR